MKVKVNLCVDIPKVPNFLRLEDGTAISVSDITDEGLREIGKMWTEELIKNSQRISKEKAKP